VSQLVQLARKAQPLPFTGSGCNRTIWSRKGDAQIKLRSQNGKLADKSKGELVHQTATGVQTCPTSCPFLGNGCYGENGRVGLQINDRLEHGTSARSAAIGEAACIDEAPATTRDGRPIHMRLHVRGDTLARWVPIVASAVSRYVARSGFDPLTVRPTRQRLVWGYTHVLDVQRATWGPDISILASVQQASEIQEARDRGFAAAIVVNDVPSARGFHDESTGEFILPCPVQSGRASSCISCGLCLRDQYLYENGITIAFSHADSVSETNICTRTGSRSRLARTAQHAKFATL